MAPGRSPSGGQPGAFRAFYQRQRRYYLNVADDILQRAILRLYADDPV